MPSYQEPDEITTSGEPITGKVGYLVKRVQAALRTAMDADLRPLGLSVSQYAILEALFENAEECTNAAIARRCFITPQSGQRNDGDARERRARIASFERRHAAYTLYPDEERTGEMHQGSPARA